MSSSTWLDRDEGWELVRTAAINSLETSHRHSSPNHDRSYRILSISEDKIVIERIGRDRKPQQQPLTRKTVFDMIDVLNEHPGGCERTKLNGIFYKTNLLIDLHPRLRLESSGRVTVVPSSSAAGSAIRPRPEPQVKIEVPTVDSQDTHKKLDALAEPKEVSNDVSHSNPKHAPRSVDRSLPSAQKMWMWNSFCREHRVLEDSVPLFEMSGGEVRLTPYGRKNPLPVLTRSREMNATIEREAQKVIRDFHSNSDEFDGLIYMMLRESDGSVEPLYIGKTEKFGRARGNPSANLSTSSISAKFCRWGYDYAYHIGDLSAVVCPAHDSNRRTPKYERWAEVLFDAFPTANPKLKSPIRFWISAWKSGGVGIWQDFGPTSLTFLEYLLIGVASDIFPELLNREGVNRC